MKKPLLSIACLSLPLVFSPSAYAAAFSQIIGFGDSLSDTGQLNALVQMATNNQASFPPPPYFDGRFSNGPIWLEYLADSLNVTPDKLMNSAFGGATSGAANTLDTTFAFLGLGGLPLIGLEQQIGAFLANNPTPDPQALYVIWIGANDYLPTNSFGFSPESTPNATLSNIQSYLYALEPVQPQNILLVNLPDLGQLPKTRNDPQYGLPDGICPPTEQFDPDCLNNLTTAHNLGLSSLIPPDGAKMVIVDINALFENVLTNPSQFGFSNVTEGCLEVFCTDPDQFFFWDEQHPSSHAHRLIANQALRALGIPEPGMVFSLIIFGLMGIKVQRR